MCQGNVVLWKPSDTAMSASYAVYKVLRDCGLPPNIIQFVPADGPVFGDTITSSEHLAGINFTGSVPYVISTLSVSKIYFCDAILLADPFIPSNVHIGDEVQQKFKDL